ncbi:uncharacterized protein LOC132717765 [Ruditapes philippinarum]|uniref:uncharacterized protein LOC132717765 n=1 Tax=Ruditapes philippinarum TaxID=129788 RepID=UPI00295B1169|nr:uncharacterized protein LOC132717765 [Ruditapes philippinarum]
MDINKKINKRLDINGYSVEARKTNQITKLIGAFLEERFIRKVIISGSFPEGSDLFGSDFDVMEVVNEFTVIEERCGGINHDLLQCFQPIPVYISRHGCSLGYCKIKIDNYTISMLKNIGITRVLKGVKISKLIEKKNNVYFLSSKLFREKVLPGGYVPESPNKAIFTCNGPAMTCGNLDTVICLEINQWPSEAIIWKTRKRKNNWPSKNTLDSLDTNVSCYVVPIGSKSSREQDMEWRISFTAIERHLIWSMNDTQFKCFVLLKALNKQYLKDISSYHIKNVALWLCEETPETDWKSELLVHCVRNGLLKLAEYVEKGILPHYIIPEKNLFLHKNNAEKKEAKTLIDDVLNNLNIKINLENLRYRVQEIRLALLCRNNDIRREKYTSLEQFHSLAEYFGRYSIIPMAVTSPGSLNQSLVEPTCESIEITFGKDGKDLSPCIRLAFTTSQLKKCPRPPEQEIDSYISKILKFKEFDYLTVPLTCAVIYFEYRRFSDIRSILLPKLQDESGKYYITPFSTWPCSAICLKTGKLKDFLPILRSCDPARNRQNIVLNFPFYWDDRDSIPYPLQLQIYLFGPRCNIQCDPLILSCYLLYLCAYNLRLCKEKKSMQKVFENALSTYDFDNYFHFVHLNLFGHMKYVSGDRKSSFKYFAKSIKVYPAVKNAAVYHIAFMINDLLQTK